jgi:hypothetical protein
MYMFWYTYFIVYVYTMTMHAFFGPFLNGWHTETIKEKITAAGI